MHVTVTDGCISCGLCAETCPAVFYIADDGRADIKQDPTPETLEACVDAEQVCPVKPPTTVPWASS